MKSTPSLLRAGLQQAALLIGLGLCQGLAATATFTNTPAVVSNTYAGSITLQIGGLTNGETVVVKQFLDANTNGVIDAGDWLVQQFPLMDGAASVIGGIVNSNVPGDTTPTNSAITAQMSFLASGTALPMPGRYLYKLSSPGGHFTPVTNSFTVTNVPYSQSITGNVVCSGTNVPNAVVMAFSGPVLDSTPVAGVVGNSAGGYNLQLPPGTYGLIAFKTNYVANTVTAPSVVLGSGATVATNLSLLPTSCTITGRVQDAANSSLGLPALWIFPLSTNGLVGIGITDGSGNFTAQVTSNLWKISYDDTQLPALGYVRLQNRPRVDTSTGNVASVTISLPKATALIYGSVKDAESHPLVGGGLDAWDDGDQYESMGITDQNGNYAAALIADTWALQPDSSSPVFANYIFPQVSGITVTNGQAVRQDLVGLLATNQISGTLKDGSSNPITNVWIWAQTTNNGTVFQTGMDTDGMGHYAFNVGNGTWQVMVNCGGGNNSLGGQYLCPDSQIVTIANNDTNVYFTALLPTSQIKGYVKDNSNNAITNVGVYAYMPTNGGPGLGTPTDGSGYYSFNVANGNWNVSVDCCMFNGLNPRGYVCVGPQSTNVFNSTNTVNFTVPPAPYQITGHVRDAYGNPIANVGVNAGSGSSNACATTAGDGSYTLNVSSGGWFVSPDCSVLASLGYLCPNGQSITVSNASVVQDFNALLAPYTISGSVKNTSNQPFTNLNVYANTTIGTNYFGLNTQTDGSGNYSLPVGNGQWTLGVDCGGLGSGYLCPDPVTINIAGASVVTNFTIQPCGPLQVLTTSPLPAGQVGVSYSFYLQASSCYPSFYWILVSPPNSLPPGIVLTNSGELYGVPTTNGTFDFTVQVTDGNDHATTKALSLTVTPAPGDVLSYSITKMEAFWQSAPTTLVPDTNHGPFNATLSIIQSALDTVPIANVYLPGGGVKGFPRGTTAIELQVREYFASQAAFDAVYTNGNYTFAMATRDNGFQFPVLTNPAAVYPAAPRVSNYAAAQAINPASPFTLQWSTPPDATTNDYIWVFIVNGSGATVFSTPYPATNAPTSLRGTATSVVIPTNTFQLGGTYTGVIVFFRITSVNTTAYPGGVGMTLVGVDTAVSMAAPLAVVPVLSQPTWVSSNQFGFLLSGAPGQNYTVLSSGDIALPLSNWFPLLTTNLPGNSAFIQDNQATNKKHFYRVKVGP